ncbi:3745_t:CDS:2 [Paraglomus occultum]|uniref:3745_t:CDS:1 n=1 Tax=Paraglomus occultum TaxID=144539 RepID=A0A9N8ZCS7_9GLOM|nr:3745_t:CDS:2 [Paraglomus occultum]
MPSMDAQTEQSPDNVKKLKVTYQRIDLGEVTPNNIGQLKRLNSVIFPVAYSEQFYKNVLEVGEFAKLGRFDFVVLTSKERVSNERIREEKEWPGNISNTSVLGTRQNCKNGINNSLTLLTSAYFNDACVGAVCCRKEPIPNSPYRANLYIMTLGVLAPYRHLGIGTTLLNHILHHATLPSQTPKFVEIYLHVQTSNDEALAFYKRNDFEIVGTREGYYKRIEPPDAHILKRVLIKD